MKEGRGERERKKIGQENINMRYELRWVLPPQNADGGSHSIFID